MIKPVTEATETLLDLDSREWYYKDDHQVRQGPFSLQGIKKRYQVCFFLRIKDCFTTTTWLSNKTSIETPKFGIKRDTKAMFF